MKTKLMVLIILALLISINISFAQSYEASAKIIGVDNQGKGIVGNVSVEIQPGKGRVLVDTEPLTGVYTQDSERVAVKVASDITGFDSSKYDVIYTIRTPNTNIVEGPSAGSMMTLVTVAAIKGKTISDSFSMTGTIQEDHAIGKIGGVLAKAKAAADSGVTVFLIPKGQAVQYEYVRKTKSPAPGWVVETIEPVEVNVIELAKEWGMQVFEVSTIEDATQHAFGEIPVHKVKRTPSTSSLSIPLFSSPISIYKEFGSLAEETVRYSQSTYNEAKNKLDKAIIPDDVKGTLDALLTQAGMLNDDAAKIESRGYKYSSGNNAFRSIIDSETVSDLVDYYLLPNQARRAFLVNKVNEVKKEIANTKPEIEDGTKNAICDANKFEWAVAARQRITYAENKVMDIVLPENDNINMTSPADILFDVNTAEEWIRISKDFASKANSNVSPGCLEKFKTAANEVLTDARTKVIMSETKELTKSSDGKWFLDAAEKEFFQGWYITAIYDATSAKVRSEMGNEYERTNITNIYGDFNKFDYATSDLIGTIFFEHSQYLIYTAVKDEDQRAAVEAITLINLAKEIDAAYSNIKSQLTPGKAEFRMDKDTFTVLLALLFIVGLIYVIKLRNDVKRLEERIRLSRKIKIIRKRKN